LDEPEPPDSPDPPSLSSDPPDEIEAPPAPTPPHPTPPSTEAEDEPDADADDDVNQPAEEAPKSRILPDEGADLPTYVLTEADKLLDSVFVDHIHHNDGSQLDGNIDDDRIFQKYWPQVAGISPVLYSVPQCRIGKIFLSCVTALLRTARNRHCNSEKVVVFISVILQKKPGVSQALDIKRRLANRLKHWEKGSYRDLVNDVIGNSQGRTRSQTPPTKENFARAYNAKMFSGRIRQAVHSVTNREGGGVLGPADRCTKTGRPVIDVLHVKHPPLHEPSDIGAATFEHYAELPDPPPQSK
jgi:hypothetical protein